MVSDGFETAQLFTLLNLRWLLQLAGCASRVRRLKNGSAAGEPATVWLHWRVVGKGVSIYRERRFPMSSTFAASPTAATYMIEPAHSSAHFKVRHLMIANVRGEFSKISGKTTNEEATAAAHRPELCASWCATQFSTCP